MKKNSLLRIVLLFLLVDGYAIQASLHMHRRNNPPLQSAQRTPKKRSIAERIRMWNAKRKREAGQKRRAQTAQPKKPFLKNPFAKPQKPSTTTSSVYLKPQKPMLSQQARQKFESAKASASAAAASVGKKASELKEKAKAAVSSKPVVEPTEIKRGEEVVGKTVTAAPEMVQGSASLKGPKTDADYVYDAIGKFWEIQPAFDEKTVFAWLQQKEFKNITELRSALILANQYINPLVNDINEHRATVSLTEPNYKTIYQNMLEEYQSAIDQMILEVERYVEILISVMTEEKQASTVLAKFSRFIQKCKTEGVAATCTAMNGGELTDALFNLFDRLEKGFVYNFRSLLGNGQWLDDQVKQTLQARLNDAQQKIDALGMRLQNRAEEVEQKMAIEMEAAVPQSEGTPAVEPESASMISEQDPVDQALAKIQALFALEKPNQTYKHLINKKGITAFQLIKEGKNKEAAALFDSESKNYAESTIADLAKEGGDPFSVAAYDLSQERPDFSVIAKSFELLRKVYEQLKQTNFSEWLAAFRDFFEAIAQQQESSEISVKLPKPKKYQFVDPKNDVNQAAVILNGLMKKALIQLFDNQGKSAFDLILEKKYAEAAALFQRPQVFKVEYEKLGDPLLKAVAEKLQKEPIDFTAIAREFEAVFDDLSADQKATSFAIFCRQAHVFFNILAPQLRKETEKLQKSEAENRARLEREETVRREQMETMLVKKAVAADVLGEIDQLLSKNTAEIYNPIKSAFDAIISKKYSVARNAFIAQAVSLLKLAQSGIENKKLLAVLNPMFTELEKPQPKFASLRSQISQIQANESISIATKFYLDLAGVFIYAAEIMPTDATKPLSARDANQLAMKFKAILPIVGYDKETGNPIKNIYIENLVPSEDDAQLFDTIADFFENIGEKR